MFIKRRNANEKDYCFGTLTNVLTDNAKKKMLLHHTTKFFKSLHTILKPVILF